ncbi:unnamed protein product [Victoria cruziana]
MQPPNSFSVPHSFNR